MDLNTLSPGEGAQHKKQRVGRGIGTGRGKTCGRGMKGQRARSTVAMGFEGGQTPLYRRIPKLGFSSHIGLYTVSIPLSALNALDDQIKIVDIFALKQKGLIPKSTKRVRVFLSGTLTKKYNLKGIHFTKGAKQAAHDLGCKVES
jgi:large subunit ribosomal protein L15